MAEPDERVTAFTVKLYDAIYAPYQDTISAVVQMYEDALKASDRQHVTIQVTGMALTPES